MARCDGLLFICGRLDTAVFCTALAAVARAEDAERRCRKVEGREESVREEVAELQRLLREAEIGTAQRRRRDSESGAKARGLSAEVDELRCDGGLAMAAAPHAVSEHAVECRTTSGPQDASA